MVVVDPRVAQLARKLGVNSELLRDAILRSVYLQGVVNGNVRDVVGLLNDELLPDLLGTLVTRLERVRARGFDRGPITTQRFRDLVDSVRSVVEAGVKEKVGALLDARLRAVAKSEVTWQTRLLNGAVQPFNLEFDRPSGALVRELARDRAPIGRTVREMLDGISRNGSDAIVAQLRVGIAQGDSTEKLVSRVRGTIDNRYEDGTFQQVRRGVEAAVRTATNYVTNHARNAVFEENDDVVKGVELVATLDNRTSLICLAYDGQVFDVHSGPRPPFHPNCRTIVAPVLKSWKELGLGGKFKEPDQRQFLRESLDGHAPGAWTTEEWMRHLDNTTPHRVEQMLGEARARMWRTGENGVETVRDFINDKGRVLTLDELDMLD